MMSSWILTITWLLLFCVSTTKSQDCRTYSAYIVVDGSQSIGKVNFEKVKSALNNLVSESISRNERVRIGLVIYSDIVTEEINATSNASSLTTRIDNIKYPAGGTATNTAILRAQELLKLEPSANVRIMVVVTDGVSGQPSKTRIAVKNAREENITMVAVGIFEVVEKIPFLNRMFASEIEAIGDREELRIRLNVFGPFTTKVLDAIDVVYPNITNDAFCQEKEEVTEGSEPLSEEQVEQLDKAYNFTGGVFGPFIFGQIWRSEEVLPCTGAPQVNAYVLLLNNGICGRWAEWQEDRFYHSHEGKAIIDKFHPNGTRVSECLGSTAQDPNCLYVVKIPRNWIANIRTIGKLAIFTSVIINGNNDGGQNYPLEYMYERFGEEHKDVIDQTVICYKQ